MLASELLIVEGDLARLDSRGLPSAHRDGLTARLSGALGLLPWLLLGQGDDAGAEAVADVHKTWTGTRDQAAALAELVSTLSARHPLDTTGLDAPLTRAARDEARAIHDTYCFGCHDGLGNGDPELTLPGRDLFQMAKDEVPEVFLARLVNGVRGDETLLFRTPLTDAQIGALWRYYTHN